MKILISAAESSSDIHGAQLLLALKAQSPSQEVEAFGIGGPSLQKAGLRPIVDARELLVMGFVEIVSRLPKIFSALSQLSKAAEIERPDLAVVIDYPDFHFRLAKRLKKHRIPVVYYIPPKIWVWRKGRIHKIKRLFSRVLCILPFEKEIYARENIPASYVGNPLADEIPTDLDRDQARRELGLGLDQKAIALLPGSRPSELRFHFDLFLDSALQAVQQMDVENVPVLIPLAQTSDLEPWLERLEQWKKSRQDSSRLQVQISQGNSNLVLRAVDAAIVKSGTATLEAGLLGCPHVVAYQAGWFARFMFFQVIRFKGPVGLVNLIAGWREGERPVFHEYLASEATSANLSRELIELVTSQERRAEIDRYVAKLKSIVFPVAGRSPSQMAAEQLLEVMREPRELPK